VLVAQLHEPYRPPSAVEEAGSKEFWGQLWSGAGADPGDYFAAGGAGLWHPQHLVPLYVREAGLALNVGLIYTASALASFMSRLIAGRASDRYGGGGSSPPVC
jgi:MFS family permease